MSTDWTVLWTTLTSLYSVADRMGRSTAGTWSRLYWRPSWTTDQGRGLSTASPSTPAWPSWSQPTWAGSVSGRTRSRSQTRRRSVSAVPPCMILNLSGCNLYICDSFCMFLLFQKKNRTVCVCVQYPRLNTNNSNQQSYREVPDSIVSEINNYY